MVAIRVPASPARPGVLARRRVQAPELTRRLCFGQILERMLPTIESEEGVQSVTRKGRRGRWWTWAVAALVAVLLLSVGAVARVRGVPGSWGQAVTLALVPWVLANGPILLTLAVGLALAPIFGRRLLGWLRSRLVPVERRAACIRSCPPSCWPIPTPRARLRAPTRPV